MQMLLKFYDTQRAYSLMFISTILTAFFSVSSFAAVLVHIVNAGILAFVCYEARKAENYFVATIGIFLSLGLTALMMYPPNWLHAVVFCVNFGLILAMCQAAAKEVPGTMAKKA
jgi:hypothetical protein